MSFHGSQSVRSCSAQLRLRHGKEAERLVARQIKWANGRGNDREIAYWNSVLEELATRSSRH